jgi:hypothetical protein
MARENNGIITYNDAQFMVANLGFRFKIGGCPSTDRCMTRFEIDKYLATYDLSYQGYQNNQLVPYDRINRALYVQPRSPLTIGSSNGTINIEIETFKSFTISRNVGWLTLSANFGTSDETVIATYLRNNSGSTRSAIVTIDAVGEIYELVINQLEAPGVPVTIISVGYNVSSSASACDNHPSSSVYIASGGDLFYDQIYNSSSGTTKAPSGWYSDGSTVREWSGTGWVGGTEFCS